MPPHTDDALIAQYHDASNLNARVRLHERFSTNPRGWHEWVFDQLRGPAENRVLELGCGPGYLWLKNAARISEGWTITLSDLSPGMLAEAKRNLGGSGRSFRFAVVDAQAIPYADRSFDVVIANHMLYHVPNRERALAEIRRVLRPGGRLYATTGGENDLRELRELVNRFASESVSGPGFAARFTLENGADQIRRWFPQVALHRYDDALVVTEAEPLVAYVLSGLTKSALDGDRGKALIRAVNQQLASDSAIRITKDAGLFEASVG